MQLVIHVDGSIRCLYDESIALDELRVMSIGISNPHPVPFQASLHATRDWNRTCTGRESSVGPTDLR